MKKTILLSMFLTAVSIGCDKTKPEAPTEPKQSEPAEITPSAAVLTDDGTASEKPKNEIPEGVNVPDALKNANGQPLAAFIPKTFEGAMKMPSVSGSKPAETYVSASYTMMTGGKRGVISLRITDIGKGGKKTARGTKVGKSETIDGVTFAAENIDGRHIETSIDAQKKIATATTTIDEKIQVDITVRPAENTEAAKRYLSQINFLGLALHLRKQRPLPKLPVPSQ